MHRNNQFLMSMSLVKPITFSLSLFLLALFHLGSAVASTEQAIQWVQKMSMAMNELSYKGRFVYQQNNQLESMSIIHVKDRQGTRERLISLNGEAREILRDNNNLTCVWPSSRQVVVDQSNQNSSSPIWAPDDVERLAKFYEFSILGKDRVADHPTIIISIKPKDKFRYGMKVWLDEKTGLLLQSVLFDEQGRTKEQIMFTELTLMHYDDQNSFSVIPEIDSGYALIRSHSGRETISLQAEAKWQLESLPGGFWIETSFRKKMPESNDYTQQMIITDGMASVSVFIERTSGQSLLGESSMGAVNAFGTRINEFTVTAIGEVPAVTVKKLAESTVYQN
ncbi:MAG: MucB/RseB C-terminal domain-containing protein [Thiotrichaceae bacterium]|nr:MucB/RseB C-terminal domain-containing protein [Thiotrichaceae bacterium]